MSPFFVSSTAVLLFGWLLIVLPIFDSIHHWFFQITHREARSYRYFDWYQAFFKALRQRPASLPSLQGSLTRKVLLYFTIVFAVFAISILPLAPTMTLNTQMIFFDYGSEQTSPVFIIVLFLFMEFFVCLLGFTFKRHFVAHTSLEKFVLSISCIMILWGALATLPHVYTGATLRSIIESQTQSTSLLVPAWGGLMNPFAFFCCLLAASIYIQRWRDEDYPRALSVTTSLQSGLLGPELIAYRIARSLKHLLLYSVLVTVFLGGPFLSNAEVHPLIGLGIFTSKVFLVSIFALAAHIFIPRLRRLNPYRAMFLVFLPLLAVGYPIALVLREFLHYN